MFVTIINHMAPSQAAIIISLEVKKSCDSAHWNYRSAVDYSQLKGSEAVVWPTKNVEFAPPNTRILLKCVSEATDN